MCESDAGGTVIGKGGPYAADVYLVLGDRFLGETSALQEGPSNA